MMVTIGKLIHYVNRKRKYVLNKLKVGPSGLRQFLAAESPLKMMKNSFYFTSKALFRSEDI